jgi:hypothetical protein
MKDMVLQAISVGIEIVVFIWGIAAFVSKINLRLDRIESEYKPNHGSSLRDAINRIEQKLAKLEGRFEQHVDETEE